MSITVTMILIKESRFRSDTMYTGITSDSKRKKKNENRKGWWRMTRRKEEGR